MIAIKIIGYILLAIVGFYGLLSIMIILEAKMRKKRLGNGKRSPFVIDAIQYLRAENIGEILNWFAKYGDSQLIQYNSDQNEYYVNTPDGIQMLSEGAFITRDLNGYYEVFEPERVFWNSSIRR